METDLAQRVGEALGVEVVGLSAPPEEGYTNNERRVARLADGRSVFVKAAVDELTAGWLRDEYRVYAAVEEDSLPELIGWRDEGDRPLLILEDLSSAYWPPPWDAGQVGALARTLDRIARASPPRGLDPLENRRVTSPAGNRSPRIRSPSSPWAFAHERGSKRRCPRSSERRAPASSPGTLSSIFRCKER